MNTALQTTDSNTAVVPMDVSAGALQAALAGDLSRMAEPERLKFYGALCNFTGLNPLAKPFDWLTFQGKLTLYANKGCAEQLRKINSASVDIIERKVEFGCFIVRVKITDKSGRYDEALAALPFNEKSPDAVALAMMKCETKAKRRATLSFYGLSMLVEREEDRIEGATVARDIVSTIDTAEDRAAKLNASLTAGQKSTAVEAEVVTKTEPVAEVKTVPVEVVSTPQSEPVAPAEEAFPVETPQPATTAKPVDEDAKFWMEVETVLSESTKSFDYLVSQGKFVKGANINTIDKTFAQKVLKHSKQFHAAVENWAKGQKK